MQTTSRQSWRFVQVIAFIPYNDFSNLICDFRMLQDLSISPWEDSERLLLQAPITWDSDLPKD